jgi:hypothetical protein
MAFITQTYVGDNTLQLGMEEFVRPMAFGAQWRKIRIGLLFGVYGNPGVNTSVYAGSNVNLYVGVCQGVNSGFSNPTPTDAIVLAPFTSNSALNYATTTYWSAGLNPGRLIWKYGSSTTTVTGGSNSIYGFIPPNRIAWFFDFAMNPRNASSALLTPSTWITYTTPSNVSRSQFLASMQNEADPALNTSNLLSASLTYAGNFLLDSVCVWWTRSIPTLLISEISVTRFY